jgi:hypothetical protein
LAGPPTNTRPMLRGCRHCRNGAAISRTRSRVSTVRRHVHHVSRCAEPRVRLRGSFTTRASTSSERRARSGRCCSRCFASPMHRSKAPRSSCRSSWMLEARSSSSGYSRDWDIRPRWRLLRPAFFSDFSTICRFPDRGWRRLCSCLSASPHSKPLHHVAFLELDCCAASHVWRGPKAPF